MRRLLALLVLALTLFACTGVKVPLLPYSQYERHVQANPSSYVAEVWPVYVDKSFKADARADIHAAVEEWNFAFNGYVTYLIVSDSFDMDMKVLETLERTHQGLVVLSVPDTFLDLFVPEGVLAWVDSLGDPFVHVSTGRIGTRDLKKIVMHEIGHTLQIGHTQASGTLMSAYYQDQVNCIDRYTLQTLTGSRYARAVHWDWHHMNYCLRP